ncbi:heterokaryon incompatibility protein-domain-containing protein [Diplogelasinospora grovesii]|uniref:Heterokaryon incompatibility protein-domain-containing protein n=1 Tax=Diplogelasinospora grovesii TaxID=303347 RepID=A0AAN6N6T4_9PEZI|nr:heterokaryon incompatibility protein-domain-containing protein [Diplogelasinospora grovesii]
MSGLCQLCEKLDFHDAFGQAREEEEELSSEPSRWHAQLSLVQKSAATCALCALVMKGWRQSRETVVENSLSECMFDPQENSPADLNESVTNIEAYSHGARLSLEVVRRPRMVDDGRRNRHSLFLRAECAPRVRGSWEAHDPLVTELRIVREPSSMLPDDDISSPVVDELVLSNPLSQNSLAVARGWLETCVKHHGSTCSPSGGGGRRRTPSRLLEVVTQSAGNNTRVYLREAARFTQNNAVDTRYVALSHCWGWGGTPFTTTTRTLKRRMDGIEMDELPQTLRDAVVVVSKLGLRYLWIDSLCIVQDDAHDWYAESAEMAGIYRNAHLVLGAAAGPSDAVGFLGNRQVLDVVQLPAGNGKPFSLALQLLPPQGRRWTDPEGPDSLLGEPLSARAWCLQERYLPTRALYYGTGQAFWECEKMRVSEDGDAVAQRGSHLKRLCKTSNISQSVFARARSSQSTSRSPSQVSWAGWYGMVEDYTARGITKHTDRLPALSGLAQSVAGATGAEYLAGLWKSGLLEGLVWCRAQPGQIMGDTLAVGEYVAPSWSWASVTGPVQFPIYTWYDTRARWKSMLSDFESLAEHVSHSTDKKDLDPYGRLQSGSYLRIRAPLLPVVAVLPRQANPPVIMGLFGQEPLRSAVADKTVELRIGGGRRSAFSAKQIWIEGGFDGAEVAGTRELYVVFLTRLPHVLDHGWAEHRFGLIVERLENGQENHYRRVGFVDGCILGQTHSSLVRWAMKHVQQQDPDTSGNFGIVGYRRPYKNGDVDDEERPNNLVSDPLHDLAKVEITMF